MRKLVLLLLITTLSANATQAAVFARDLVPGSGDGLLTFDDVNQREWLDVPETLLVNFMGTTIEERFQSAAMELAIGGIFEGFTIAKSNDFIALAQSAGIDTDQTTLGVNEIASRKLIDLVGQTSLGTSTGISAIAFLDELEPLTGCNCRIVGGVAVNPPFDLAGIGAGPPSSSVDGGLAPFAGVWLYRQVPEPLSCHLIVLGMILLPTRRRP